MERVVFLIEETNETVSCWLNPEHVIVRRTAGVRTRRSLGGLLTGATPNDDPLLYTGGGVTELELKLLFDLSLVRTQFQGDDVRTYTSKFWAMSENSENDKPPLVRFMWGTHWNVLGVIVAVAERLEQFTATGAPRRSWLHLRMRRVSEQTATLPSTNAADITLKPLSFGTFSLLNERLTLDSTGWETHELLGDPDGDGERLDQIASTVYGSAAQWRLLALFNNIDNPLDLNSGLLLSLPPLTAVQDALEQSSSPNVEERP